MQNTDIQQMLVAIMEHADTKPNVEFKFLTSWSEYKHFRGKRRYLKLLTSMLERCSERMFKKYCKAVASGDASVNTLIAYNQLQWVLCYYEEDLRIINDIIWEYEAYLLEGNYLSAFLGEPRADVDMRDFRE